MERPARHGCCTPRRRRERVVKRIGGRTAITAVMGKRFGDSPLCKRERHWGHEIGSARGEVLSFGLGRRAARSSRRLYLTGRAVLIDKAHQDHIFASLSDGVCAPAVTLGIFWRSISKRPDLDKNDAQAGPPTHCRGILGGSPDRYLPITTVLSGDKCRVSAIKTRSSV
jgi:hypothetical protein